VTGKYLLEGRVAIVTGAGLGIGRAIANRLAASGAHIIVNDIDEISAREVEAAIQRAGGEATVVVGSVAAANTADAMVKAAWDHWGRLDILVNNASVTRDAMIHLMSDEWFALVMEVTVKGTFQCIRASTPLMRAAAQAELIAGKRVHRQIVNIASTAGIYGAVGKVSYAAAKAAVIGMTKTVAREWAPFLINCNAVAPGVIAPREEAPNPENVGVTDVRTQLPTQAATGVTGRADPTTVNLRSEQIAAAAAEIVDKAAQCMPLGRIGTPDDDLRLTQNGPSFSSLLSSLRQSAMVKLPGSLPSNQLSNPTAIPNDRHHSHGPNHDRHLHSDRESDPDPAADREICVQAPGVRDQQSGNPRNTNRVEAPGDPRRFSGDRARCDGDRSNIYHPQTSCLLPSPPATEFLRSFVSFSYPPWVWLRQLIHGFKPGSQLEVASRILRGCEGGS
jgi:3-oxoacyl-[acyl-carrier protein] reductase